MPERAPRLARGLRGLPDGDAARRRPRGAWTAASRSATRAARSATSSRTGTTSCTANSWRDGDRAAARDEQLPGVHGPPLSGAVRGGLRARHQRRPRDDQAGRATASSSAHGRKAGSSQSRRRCITGKTVAVIGSGPAGLAARSNWRARATPSTVFERDDRIGGLLRYGIPDFKMEKWVIDRRLEQMEEEGVTFKPSTNVGKDVRRPRPSRRSSTRVCLTRRRDASCATSRCPGRELKGTYFAMEFLPLQNKRGAGDEIPDAQFISAKDKRVIILGGGDTGADCLGTVHRQGAKSVIQIELLPRPPEHRAADDAVADVAEHLPRLVRARGGRRPRVQHPDEAPLRRERRAQEAARRPRRVRPRGRPAAGDEGSAGHGVRGAGRPAPARDGLPRPGALHGSSSLASS